MHPFFLRFSCVIPGVSFRSSRLSDLSVTLGADASTPTRSRASSDNRGNRLGFRHAPMDVGAPSSSDYGLIHTARQFELLVSSTLITWCLTERALIGRMEMGQREAPRLRQLSRRHTPSARSPQLLNTQKGAKSPDQWVPPDTRFSCAYIIAWEQIRQRWQLNMTVRERAALDSVRNARACPN
jgi:hypothetical protein